MALGKPPINTQADSIAVKGWFSNIYRELNSGILVPGGGNIVAPTFPSRRNLLVNGDFMINQRAASYYNNVGLSTNTWTIDRWALQSNAGTLFLNNPPLIGSLNYFNGFDKYINFDIAIGDTTALTGKLGQAIGSKKSIPCAGLPITLSFWAFAAPNASTSIWATQTLNNTSGQILAVVNSGTGTDEATLSAFTGSKTIITIGATPNRPYWTYFSGTGIVPVTAKELQVYFQVQRTTTAYSTPAYLGLAGVQLEVGTQPTAFDKISFDQSLIECQRFYEKSFDYAVTPGPVTANNKGAIIYKAQVASTTAGWDAPIAFKVRKAKDPTMTAYCINNAGAPTAWWNFTRFAVSGVSVFTGQGEWGFVARNPQITADSVGNEIGLHWDASADI